jgi:transcription elongation factor GreA
MKMPLPADSADRVAYHHDVYIEQSRAPAIRGRGREETVAMAMQANEVPLTQSGYDEMQRELEHLRTVRRREIAEEIRDAWESELDKDIDVALPFESAKEDQAWVEGRIAALEDMLGKASIIDEDAARASKTVTLGSIVTLVNGDGDEHEYQIVGSPESAPEAGKLSQDSPVGQAVIGKRAGTKVKVKTPSGTKQMQIKSLR